MKGGDGWFTRKLLRISKVLSDWFGPGPASHWASEPGLFLESTADQCALTFPLLSLGLFLCRSFFSFFLFPSLSLSSLISSSILSLFLFPTLLTLHFPQPVIQIVSSPLYSIFQYARNFAYTEHNLIRTIRRIETTNQAVLLHRQARKQIKLADVLTLYFPSLF